MTYPMTAMLSTDLCQKRSISSALVSTARRPLGVVGGSLSFEPAKAALTVSPCVTVTLHVAARPQSGRDQPAKTKPGTGVAVRLIVRPPAMTASHCVGQRMLGPRTEPFPATV